MSVPIFSWVILATRSTRSSMLTVRNAYINTSTRHEDSSCYTSFLIMLNPFLTFNINTSTRSSLLTGTIESMPLGSKLGADFSGEPDSFLCPTHLRLGIGHDVWVSVAQIRNHFIKMCYWFCYTEDGEIDKILSMHSSSRKFIASSPSWAGMTMCLSSLHILPAC
jgi:hypothetical protein